MALTIEQVKAKSRSRLSSLHPVVKYAADKLIERCYRRGVNIVIVQGTRTLAEQAALYAQGRTAPGQKVTNAKPGSSFHNFAVAIDFALLTADGRSVSWDTIRDADGDGVRDWNEVVAVAKSIGFVWGGDFKSITDKPHFEMTFGLSLSEWRSGVRPTDKRLAAAIALIDKGDDEPMTAQEKAAFESLQNVVKAQAETVAQLQKKLDGLKIEKVSAPAGSGGNDVPIPDWAADSIKRAHDKGAINTVKGSWDFYRLVVILDNLGFFNK